MKLLKLWRTFKEGIKNFYRNGWLTFATVSVMSISLYIMALTMIVVVGANAAIRDVQERINISIYFNPEVKEDRILEVRNKLAGYREIKSVEYVSKDKALDEFMQITNNDPSIKEAIEEIGENPLLNSLVIRAQNPEQYETINDAIINSNFAADINQTNYTKNEDEIKRLNDVIKTVEKVGFILGTIFILVAVLITFNTIRITIYAHKQEFEVMRLVGASNLYVRMPHVFEGIFYGSASALIVMALLYPSFQFMGPSVQKIISRENLIGFYFDYFWVILVLLLLAGIFIGVLSSFVAIRRYLKI